jgi:thymidylate kinase
MALDNNYYDDKKIVKIVITGGPCAGKTTAMSWITNTFTKQGYAVLFIPETATGLITSGVAPWTCDTALDYQRVQVYRLMLFP